ncbi:hypothetical protein NPIL_629381 [Nephila pilipes]|uniref:Uncharacterized protein n=1 Tax=Nephila pilipes TaxID=299642 RepID=A0A8X6QB60_NEPPI|nr:hypothetical protein NPIL_629381 [Nephila pilipes]
MIALGVWCSIYGCFGSRGVNRKRRCCLVFRSCDPTKNTMTRKRVYEVDYGAELFKVGVMFQREALRGNFHEAVIRNQCLTANRYFGNKRANRKTSMQICPKLVKSDDERHFKSVW